MKKVIVAVLAILLLAGCTDMMNTPTKKVEEFLGKYQTMDSKVLNQLDDVLDADLTMSKDQKEKYRDLMKKQYQNLTYKIKDERVDGDDAAVEVEIEVYDYNKAMKNAEKDLEDKKKDFLDKEGNVDESKFMDYKIEQMETSKEKVTYTINFLLTKKDDKWKMEDISEIDRQKIHGIYEY